MKFLKLCVEISAERTNQVQVSVSGGQQCRNSEISGDRGESGTVAAPEPSIQSVAGEG